MAEYSYVGGELEIFREAVNWKGYVRRSILPYFGGRVLEVGAGIGGTTEYFTSMMHDSWLSLEPDPQFFSILEQKRRAGLFGDRCSVRCGYTEDMVGENETFDTILYIDVLEHIEDDVKELEIAASLLSEGGHIVVLSPAYGFLFSAFDRCVGHYRRYNRKMLQAVTPSGEVEQVALKYLDSVGCLCSIWSRFACPSGHPSRNQILVWDRVVVRMSVLADWILFYRCGKSILSIWRKLECR